MKLITTVQTDAHSNAYIKAELIHTGADGWDSYHWEWGIDSVSNGYLVIESGEIQHRECDGSFKLVGMIIKKLGIKL